jgi:hypothetical protein
MYAEHLTLRDGFLLAVPSIASVFFFVCYANRFHPTESKLTPGTEVQTLLQTEALIITPVILILIITIVLIKTHPSVPLISYYLVYAILFAAYGLFLLKYNTNGTLPQVRHQLVWPVVLTIGVSLYYGLSFIQLNSSLFRFSHWHF